VTPAELLTSRAELLLGEAERQGKGVTLHALDEIAKRVLPDVEPVNRRAAVNEAMRIENRRNDPEPLMGTPNGKRQSFRGTTPTPPGMMTPAQIYALTLGLVKRHPDMKAVDMWAEIEKLGRPRLTFPSWRNGPLVKARKEARNGSAPAPVAKPAKPAPAPKPAPLPAVIQPPPVALAAPAAPALPATLDAPHSDLRKSEPVPAVEVGARPGCVEIAGNGDSFKATRRDDGGWDIELRGRVDDTTMGQLARILWERVVGSPGVAA
jgi:hypothetical protein